MFKKCSSCKASKKENEFYKFKKGGFSNRCVPCDLAYKNNPAYKARQKRVSKKWYEDNKPRVLIKMRNNSLLKNYGIDIEYYDKLAIAQKDKCAICSTNAPGRKKQNYFSVDHCHKTGKIRGLLCDQCNKGLGHFKDNIEYLRKAIEYVERTS